MKTITWIPNSNKELDEIFNGLREKQFRDQSHRLYKNYSQESFADAGIIAYTIHFNNNGDAEMCSSISNRNCWPKKAFRILNRTWKTNNKQPIMKEISQAMGQTTLSQISWLQSNIDLKLYFISRQTENWMYWVTRNFKRQFNLDFKIAENKYLTCPNECDDSCWQNIIYNGDTEILKSWKNK